MWVVVGVVVGWVVGVDGVGGVGGDAGGALVGAFGFVEVEAEGIGGAFEGVLEDGAAAPVVVAEPISSWSKQARMRMSVAASAASMSAVMAG